METARDGYLFYLCALYGWLLSSVQGSGLRIVSRVAPGLPGNVVLGNHFSCMPGADPATRICYARMVKRADDGATYKRSTFSEQWAATMYRSCMTVMNRHLFALHVLVLHDSVPMSKTHATLFTPPPAPSSDGHHNGHEGLLRACQAIVNLYCPSKGITPYVDLLKQVAGWMSGTFSNRGFDSIMSFESLSVFFRNICGILVLSDCFDNIVAFLYPLATFMISLPQICSTTAIGLLAVFALVMGLPACSYCS
jgi:hypothetical protein